MASAATAVNWNGNKLLLPLLLGNWLVVDSFRCCCAGCCCGGFYSTCSYCLARFMAVAFVGSRFKPSVNRMYLFYLYYMYVCMW